MRENSPRFEPHIDAEPPRARPETCESWPCERPAVYQTGFDFGHWICRQCQREYENAIH